MTKSRNFETRWKISVFGILGTFLNQGRFTKKAICKKCTLQIQANG
jgi:hypothetical protein